MKEAVAVLATVAKFINQSESVSAFCWNLHLKLIFLPLDNFIQLKMG